MTRHRIWDTLAMIGAFVAIFVLARQVPAWVMRPRTTVTASAAADPYGSPVRQRALYDSATRYFAGRVQLATAIPARGSSMLLLVTAQDCLTCEDLGRQLRELEHTTRAQHLPLIVVARATDTADIAVYLRRQRVQVAAIVAEAPDSAVTSSTGILTPAVAIVDAHGTIVRAVSHPRRLPNVRVRSFAEELGLSAHAPLPGPRVGSGAVPHSPEGL